MVIVDVEEVAECFDSLSLGGVGADVGPFLEHGAIEALYFSIGLGPIGPGAPVFDGAESFGEGHASITATVVGEDLFDRDPQFAEPGSGPIPEASRGVLALISKDL